MKIVTVVALVLIAAVPAAAQDAGAVVAASAGVTAMNGGNSFTITGSGGYRFNRYVGLEVEVTAIPTLKGPFPAGQSDGVVIPLSAGPASISGGVVFPGTGYTNADGRVVIVSNNVRVDMPTASARLTPFFVAGGGVASVRHTADYSFPIGILAPPGGPPTPIRTVTQTVTSASTDLALSIGGGIAVKIASRASVDGDLRFFRLLGSTDSNAGRFSVGVRYRF